MSAAILTEDLLGICLLLVKGDTKASLADVCSAVER